MAHIRIPINLDNRQIADEVAKRARFARVSDELVPMPMSMSMPMPALDCTGFISTTLLLASPGFLNAINRIAHRHRNALIGLGMYVQTRRYQVGLD